ncbi:MAG: SprB repeat-containing protein [Bacteroidia bacterium]
MSPVSCNGGSDGCAYVQATGGPSGTYTFQWSNGGTNDTICGLTAGMYYVTVTDTTGGGSVFAVVGPWIRPGAGMDLERAHRRERNRPELLGDQ